MCVTVPLVLKPRSSWLAACRLPLPETVDWTTPCAAVAVRVTVRLAAGCGADDEEGGDDRTGAESPQ